MKAGVYVVVFVLDEERTIRVGRLGAVRFRPGRYAYVGSAQRGLEKRVARHGRREKPLRWHVDHLSCRARLEAAYAWPLPKSAECRLAAALGRIGGAALAVPRFGASDCACPGHLVRLPGPLDPAAVRLGPRWARPVAVVAPEGVAGGRQGGKRLTHS